MALAAESDSRRPMDGPVPALFIQSRYRPGTLGGRRPAATGVITREFASESESQELTFGGQESSPLPTLRAALRPPKARPGGGGLNAGGGPVLINHTR